MHTTEKDVHHNPTTNKVKVSAVPGDKKMASADKVSHSADTAKEHMMPVGASSDIAKGSCGGIGKDGKPMHMAGCNCASTSSSQAAADNNGRHKVQGESADPAAPTMSAKKDTFVPNPPPKAPEKPLAHK